MGFLSGVEEEARIFERIQAEQKTSALKSKLKRVSAALGAMKEALTAVHWAGLTQKETLEAETSMMEIVRVLEITRGKILGELGE